MNSLGENLGLFRRSPSHHSINRGNADWLSPLLHQATGQARQELETLAREPDPELFLEGLLAFGGRQEQADRVELAAQFYQVLGQHAGNFAGIASRAQQRLDAILGRGPAGNRIEFLGRRFAREATSPAALIGMAGAQAVFGLTRAALLSRLLASPTSHAWTRGLGARALASSGAFLLEAPSFVAFTRGAKAALGVQQDWSSGAWGHEVAGSFFALGAMKITGWAGGSLYRRVQGTAGTAPFQGLATQTSLLGGILLGNALETAVGLRERRDGATTLIDSLALLLQFNVAGNLLHRGLGPRWAGFNRGLDLRGESLNRSFLGRFLFGGLNGSPASRLAPEGVPTELLSPRPGNPGIPAGARGSDVLAMAMLGEGGAGDSTFNRNRWFGFYHPVQTTSNASVAEVARLSDVLLRPLLSIRQAEELIETVARALPTFRRVLDRLELGRLGIRLWQHPYSLYLGKNETEGILHLPQGLPVGNYLLGFLNTAAAAIPPPEGMELPPSVPTGNAREIRDGLMRRYTWGVALSESFVFQIAHELSLLGLTTFQGGGETGLLGATDLALFRILREQGLQGVAEAYPRFMVPDRKALLDATFEKQAEQILANSPVATPAVPWSPPEVGGRPELPATLLDEQADSRSRFDQGVYQRSSQLQALPAKRRREIQRMLEDKLFNDGDLLKLRRLIEEIAPDLAREILNPWKSGSARIRIQSQIRPDVPDQPVVLLAGLERVLGLGDDQAPEILVRRGERIKNVIDLMVMHLSRLAMPSEAFPPVRISRVGSRDQAVRNLAEIIERRFSRQDLWGYSAMFELYHQAGQTGVALPKNDHHLAMERVLRESGLDVLGERWNEFTNPEVLQFMRRQFRALAERIADQLVSPVT